MANPEPYRSPHGYNAPYLIADGVLRGKSDDIEVQVSIPNEDPETEDDLTINVHFTSEGIIIDLFVSDGEPVATFGQTYDEFVDTIYALDPMVISGEPGSCILSVENISTEDDCTTHDHVPR